MVANGFAENRNKQSGRFEWLPNLFQSCYWTHISMKSSVLQSSGHFCPCTILSLGRVQVGVCRVQVRFLLRARTAKLLPQAGDLAARLHPVDPRAPEGLPWSMPGLPKSRPWNARVPSGGFPLRFAKECHHSCPYLLLLRTSLSSPADDAPWRSPWRPRLRQHALGRPRDPPLRGAPHGMEQKQKQKKVVQNMPSKRR